MPTGMSAEKASEMVLNYCNGCLKFDAGKRRCRVLHKPYPLWSQKEQDQANGTCWAREESPERYSETLKAIKAYNEENGSVVPSAVTNDLQRVGKVLDVNVGEIQNESQRTGYPWIYKMGGSDNQDGSMFGKESMKDNRMLHRKLDPKRENWDEKGRK